MPRSLSGDDSASNVVRLTAREHFIAHVLLTKFNPCRETIYAAFMMANCGDKKQIGRAKINQKSRIYQTLKESYAAEVSKIHKGKVLSEETKSKISAAIKGKVISDETKEKMSKAALNHYVNNPERKKSLSRKLTGRRVSDETKQKLRARVMTDEWRENIGNAARGRKHSTGTIAKIVRSHKGRKNTPETIQKMKDAATRRWAGRNTL